MKKNLSKYLVLVVILASLAFFYYAPSRTDEVYEKNIEKFSYLADSAESEVPSDEIRKIVVLQNFEKEFSVVREDSDIGRANYFFYKSSRDPEEISEIIDCSDFEGLALARCLYAEANLGKDWKNISDGIASFTASEYLELFNLYGACEKLGVTHQERRLSCKTTNYEDCDVELDEEAVICVEKVCEKFVDLESRIGKPEDICGLRDYGALAFRCYGDMSVFEEIAPMEPSNIFDFACYISSYKIHQFFEEFSK